MAFRTIVVKNRCKLECSMNYLVCRTGEEVKKVLLDEIEFLIIQNTAISITCALMSELVEKKVKVIFCDTKSNPQFELTPYYSNYCSYKKIQNQINFEQKFKDLLRKRIIEEKIKNERRLLEKLGKIEASKLIEYEKNVEIGDLTNREGHAAKVYFNSLFGNKFSREDGNNKINKYLNYGYSIIVSLINREIKLFGYLTELGIHHKGETNPFNLTYDFFEPLRSYVDSFVANNLVNDDVYKDFFINMLSNQVSFDNRKIFLDNAIHLYVQSLFSALINKDISEVKFVEYEL